MNGLHAAINSSELLDQLVVIIIVNVDQTVIRVLKIGETTFLRVVSPAPPVKTHHKRQLGQFGGIIHSSLRSALDEKS